MLIGDAWRQLLDVPGADVSTLLRRVAAVLEIPARLSSQVQTVAAREGYDPNVFLGWRDAVEKAFSTVNFASHWEHVVTHISGETLVTLQFCDQLLQRSSPEPVLTDEQVQSIRQQVELLQDEVTQSAVRERVKGIILHHLDAILNALDDYQVLGVEPLADAAKAAAGTLIVNRVEIWVQATPPEQKLLVRMMAIVRNIAIAVSLTVNVLQLPPHLEQFLDEGTGAEEGASPEQLPSPENPDEPIIDRA
jgi:hypothetical protein